MGYSSPLLDLKSKCSENCERGTLMQKALYLSIQFKDEPSSI